MGYPSYDLSFFFLFLFSCINNAFFYGAFLSKQQNKTKPIFDVATVLPFLAIKVYSCSYLLCGHGFCRGKPKSCLACA